MKPLTAAQWHVLTLLQDGLTVTEIAHARRTTEPTIQRHRDRAIQSLDADSLEHALAAFRPIRHHGPPPAPPPVELDTGDRYYVTALTGWPANPRSRGSNTPRIYHVHDRDYNSCVIATYDEQLKDPSTRSARALKTARDLNTKEENAHALG